MDSVTFETSEGGGLDVAELMAFYSRQHHETSADAQRLETMLARSACVATARQGGRLIGFARGVSDGVQGYLAECKLDPDFQGPAAITKTDGRIEHDEAGIARELARQVIDRLGRDGVEQVRVLAYGTEVDFCEELGFRRLAGSVAMSLALRECKGAGERTGVSSKPEVAGATR